MKPKILLKSPTFRIIEEASHYRGCLISVNQSSLFFASELEQKSLEYGVITFEQLQRKNEIEAILRLGYSNIRVPKPYLSESLLNQCFNIINDGYILLDIETPLIARVSTHNTEPQEILDLTRELIEIKVAMNYFYEYSVDVFLDRMFNYYLLSQCVFDRNFNPIFNSVEDVLKADVGLVRLITSRFIEFRNYIPECVFRALARGEADSGRRWTAKWSTCKSINQTPFAELDDNRMSLIRWTVQYENIRQGYETPPDDIMNNDVELDNWLYNKKLEKNTRSYGKDGVYFENRSSQPSVVAPNAITLEVG